MIHLHELKRGDVVWDQDFGRNVTFVAVVKKQQKTLDLLIDGQLKNGSWFEGRFAPPKVQGVA